jgi:class 3 adenylate cyclase
MVELPAGTVTFWFTDIEGSTRLWEQHPDAMTLEESIASALNDNTGGRYPWQSS